MIELGEYLFGILCPLTFVGAFAGSRCQPINLPIDRSNPPAAVPTQRWYQRLIPLGFLLGGSAVFGATFVDYFDIKRAFIVGGMYGSFGYLALNFILALVMCGMIAALACFVQLRRENYRWWWRAFWVPGGGAAFGFLIFGFRMMPYSRYQEQTSAAIGSAAPVVAKVAWYGWALVVSIGFLCIYGFIGVACTLWFNRAMYYASVGRNREDDEASADSHEAMVEMVSC